MLEINQIHHGDCLELMHEIPDGSVDMVLADLPYGTTACAWDSIIPLEPLWAHYKRIIKPRGAIVLTAATGFNYTIYNSNPEMFKYEWIWHKTMATDVFNAKNKPIKAHEYVMVFSFGTVANKSPNLMTYNPQFEKANYKYRKIRRSARKAGQIFGSRPETSHKLNVLGGSEKGKYPRTVFEFSNGNSHQKNIHPTQKPVDLFLYLIKTYTEPGQLVLDNTAGSGTTAIAAIQTGRNWLCIEKSPDYSQPIGPANPDYFGLASARIAKALGQSFSTAARAGQPNNQNQAELLQRGLWE